MSSSISGADPAYQVRLLPVPDTFYHNYLLISIIALMLLFRRKGRPETDLRAVAPPLWHQSLQSYSLVTRCKLMTFTRCIVSRSVVVSWYHGFLPSPPLVTTFHTKLHHHSCWCTNEYSQVALFPASCSLKSQNRPLRSSVS